MKSLIYTFKLNGEVTEDEYTTLNLPIGIQVRGHCLEKDEKVLCHQRAVNLTHKRTILRFEAAATKKKGAKRKEHPHVPDLDEIAAENRLECIDFDLTYDSDAEEAME